MDSSDYFRFDNLSQTLFIIKTTTSSDLSSGNLDASQHDKGANEHLQKNDCEEILNCLSLEGKELMTRFVNIFNEN